LASWRAEGSPPGAGHDLHRAGGRVHALEARRRARGVAQVPAQPRLPDGVQRVADAGELGRHLALAQPVTVQVVDGEPEARHVVAQGGQGFRRAQREPAIGPADERVAQHFQHAVLGFQRQRVAAPPRHAQQRQQECREQRDLQRHQPPHQPPAQRAAAAQAGASRSR
jgi:hypothetical protein